MRVDTSHVALMGGLLAALSAFAQQQPNRIVGAVGKRENGSGKRVSLN
jgi:hypothetical protein